MNITKPEGPKVRKMTITVNELEGGLVSVVAVFNDEKGGGLFSEGKFPTAYEGVVDLAEKLRR